MAIERSGWLNAAIELPIAFAQVREDALVDLAAVANVGRSATIVMVASGGCTAAALAASGLAASIHLVDPNPAQLALSRLKLRLLLESDLSLRRGLLGHSNMDTAERKERLIALHQELDLPIDALGPIDFIAELGPDYSGRYERLFIALRDALAARGADLGKMLRKSNTAEQKALVAAGGGLGAVLDEALTEVMALPNLVKLFGEEATRNPVTSFDRHFAARIRHTLATLPASTNPWLWQMLVGRFPEGFAYPWLHAEPPGVLPALSWERGFMQAVLEKHREEFDLVHLSNILDWLSPERAAQTLKYAFKALRRGGSVLVRQLNSTLDVPALGPQFRWEREAARTLHERDRSFFYRALHWGFKQ